MTLRKFGLAVLLLWTALASAQFIGYTTSQSTSQTLFSNQAANGPSVTITNLGQSSHFITICNTAFSGTVILESSKDGTFNPPNTVAAANYNITATTAGFGSVHRAHAGQRSTPRVPDNNCHLIQAGGYYPTLRVRVANYIQGSTSVFYSGVGGPVVSAPSAISTIGPTSPVACDLTSTIPGLAQNVTGDPIVQGLAGQTIIVCSVTISFDATTTAGALAFAVDHGPISALNCPNLSNDLFILATTPATPQTLHFVGGPGGLFRLGPGDSLCITTGSVGANTWIDTSFAQITQF